MSEPVVHKRAPAAPKQVIFPPRRHNTRSGASRNPAPKLKKRQSTLTQLDFVSTPHSSREVVEDSVSSDGEEEYPEPNPKRRRKLDPKLRDQSTLTQNWLREAKDRCQSSSDGDSMEWEEDTITIDNVHEDKAQDTQGTAKYFYGRVQEVSSDMQEHAGDGHSVASPAFVQHRMLVASSDAGDGSTRPSTAESKAIPRTPRRVRRTEVPSSQTPSSAKLSVHRSRKERNYEASPSEGRSCTPVPIKKSPCSQMSSPSKRILKHMDSDVLKIDLLTSGDIKSELWKAQIASSSRHKHMPALAERPLIRTTTVQDSQDELGVDSSSPEPSRRSVKRTSTVSDSEAGSDLGEIDEDDGEIPIIDNAPKQGRDGARTGAKPDISQPSGTAPSFHSIGNELSLHAEDEELYSDNKYAASLQQQTFDPVSAALDRDAARFGRGPTQLQTQHHSYAFFDKNDVEDSTKSYEDVARENNADFVISKERVEESEPEFVAESPLEANSETQFIADSPHAELQCQPSPEFGNTTQQPSKASSDGLVDAAPLHEIYVQSPMASSDMEDLELPMPVSPKPPRPSQVSTVASTQQTASRPNSRHGNPPTSPQTSAAWANTFSSSPFPLPPESWLAAQSYRDVETQSSGIFDFSLPPPPPLTSSAREKGTGSSR